MELHRLKTLYGDLETLLLNDYNNISNAFPYNLIYFVSDSKKSWRKMITSSYKEGRKKEGRKEKASKDKSNDILCRSRRVRASTE